MQFAESEMLHVKVESESARQALFSRTDLEFIEPNYLLSIDPVDTGLDRTHPVFKDSGSIWENQTEINGIPGKDDDRNGFVDDFYGWNFATNSPDITDEQSHGTHVAGIVLGIGQNIFALPVQESKIRIMALKFIDSSCFGSASGAISAIYYAVKKNAKVINNSWGGTSYSRALDEAYVYAYKHGVVIVSAAGNSNANNDEVPFYPANFESPNNISVMATSDNDNKAWFSNYGFARVSIAAPGVAIWSAVPDLQKSAGSFETKSGTSMAAPFVAGLAALISRESPQLTAYQIKKIIMDSVDIVPALNDKVQAGGRVNALNAIVLAQTQLGSLPYRPSYELLPADPQANFSLPTNAGCGTLKTVTRAKSQDRNAKLLLLLLPMVIAFSLRFTNWSLRF